MPIAIRSCRIYVVRVDCQTDFILFIMENPLSTTAHCHGKHKNDFCKMGNVAKPSLLLNKTCLQMSRG